MISEQETISAQEARAKLRESFLNAINELKGKVNRGLYFNTFKYTKLFNTVYLNVTLHLVKLVQLK